MTKQMAAILLATAVASGPAGAQEIGYGEAEYLNSCAVCHGARGFGDGELSYELDPPPSDLTRLTRNHGGTFPYLWVYSIIDGRYVVPGHGDRDMPVWGRQFLEGDAEEFGPEYGVIITTERIHELTGYIESLQK